ncbi:MAG: hypothetical protein K9J80_17145 [Sulfuritalea sp.]|nr:hypothetical protein [Sulfuritalea sp.]
MKRFGTSALLFAAIGAALYAGVYCAAETLSYRTGKSNAFYKIETAASPAVDWVILGASHAMPLDFSDFNAFMERETGLRILNLASPGTGPLYNRFVLEHFFAKHRTAGVLYVVDSFAFQSHAWNEDRFADAKLLRRTPFDLDIARRLLRYSRREGVDPRALLDYLTGFSKINNRERFQTDVWEGEAQFDRTYRPSAIATTKRIDYLYPTPRDSAALTRYLQVFSDLVALSRAHGTRIVVIKMPVPAQFRSQLPEEAAFDLAISQLLAAMQIPLHDFSRKMNEPRFYFDTDHLNRTGITVFFKLELEPILATIRR